MPDYDNSEVIIKENYGNLILFINIALKNIGANPAINMQFVPYGDDFLWDYFKIECNDENNYFIHKDIEGESVPKEEIVTFSIQKPIVKYVKCSSGFISFKIQYSDLMNNIYEQEFKIGYRYINGEYYFSSIKRYTAPKLIKKTKSKRKKNI